MEQVVDHTYNKIIVAKFEPAIIKLQRIFRSYREREKFKEQTIKVIKINRAFAALRRYEQQVAFWQVKETVLGKMKAQDYRMKDRTKNADKRSQWKNQTKQTRESLTILKFNMIGGILNKFYSKWEQGKIHLAMQGPPDIGQEDLIKSKQIKPKETMFEKKKQLFEANTLRLCVKKIQRF